ncbi:bifunctional 4-hydroxy-2-oxoglutarate aldolase/2-dehydro-3-deoxy-phosphogluconate aldolase [Bacillus sp. 1P06AnD]|uniref:bifunctional 4-hydroxy-2-oxoglutarate aldolase/2-dehydro-3-deoxy-phosphogluconate aldolase n=1 Tax=Bacillus sp. 1P06AnD TaxID=3132208 RepID=UPI00399FA018
MSLLEKANVVAVLRNIDQHFLECVEVMVESGIHVLEITMDNIDGLHWITATKEHFGDAVCVGAGTVLQVEQVDQCKKAGAEFIVSPHFDEGIVERTKQEGLVSIPGAFTPTEIMRALRAKADFVKVFPATTLGLPFFNNLVGPYKELPLIATGGITHQNASDYLKSGIRAVGIGSWIMLQPNENMGDYRKRIAAFGQKMKGVNNDADSIHSH